MTLVYARFEYANLHVWHRFAICWDQTTSSVVHFYVTTPLNMRGVHNVKGCRWVNNMHWVIYSLEHSWLCHPAVSVSSASELNYMTLTAWHVAPCLNQFLEVAQIHCLKESFQRPLNGIKPPESKAQIFALTNCLWFLWTASGSLGFECRQGFESDIQVSQSSIC